MPFGYRDHPIQALTPDRPDQPFAERIRLRAARRCFDDFEAHARYRSIKLGGEDRVAVMQDKPVRALGLRYAVVYKSIFWVFEFVGNQLAVRPNRDRIC